MKFAVEAGGRSVSAECADANMTVEHLREQVLEAWKALAGAPPRGVSPGWGLVTGERSTDRSASSTTMYPMATPE